MNRARQEQLEGAIKQMKALGEDSKTPRADTSALDALSKLGGSFSFGGGTELRDLARNGKDQLNVLKAIERKTGGSAVWQ
jgi:hypothetical protein